MGKRFAAGHRVPQATQDRGPRNVRQNSSVWRAGAIAAALLIAGPLGSKPAQAATYYWDSDGNTAGFGSTTGTWGTNAFWTSVVGGGATHSAVTTTLAADLVNFGGAAGLNYNNAAVSVAAGGVTATSITFGAGQTTALTVGGSSQGTITLAGPTRTIVANTSGHSILSPIALTGATTATLAVSAAGTTSLTLGAMSGTGGLTLVNTGGTNPTATFNLNGASTYSGATLLDSSNTNASVALVLGVANALPTTTVLTMDGGAGSGTGRTITLNMNGKDQTLAGLIGTSTGTPGGVSRTNRVLNGSGTLSTLTINGSSASTYTGLIGTGGTNIKLVKDGTGTFTLSGVTAFTSNTYTGGTILNQGTLTVTNDGTTTSGTLGASTGTLTVNNNNTTAAGTAAVLNLPTGVSLTVGTLSGTISTPLSGTNTATINTQTSRNFTVNQTAAGTYEGVIAGAGAFTLGSLSTNTLTLTGLNTFSGALNINTGGTLVAGIAGNGTNSALGSVSNTRTITVNTGGTLRADVGNIFSTSFAAAATSLPALAIAGGTMTNGGAATNSALGNITLTGGTLTATTGSPAGTTSGQGFGSWNLNGTVTSTGTSLISSTAGAGIPITLNATSGLSSPATIFDVTSGTLTASAVLGQVTRAGNETVGSLTKSGAGTMILSGNNTYGGLTTVNAAALRISNSGALGTTAGGTLVNNTSSARLELSGGITVTGEALTINGLGNFTGALTSFSGVNEWAGNVTIGSALTRLGATAGATLKVSGVIDSGVVNTGLDIRTDDLTGIVVLSGANTYLGNTNVLIGKLQLDGGNDRLPTATKMSLGNTTTLSEFDLNGRNQEIAGLFINAGATPANNSVNNSSVTLSTLNVNTAAASPSTFAGILKGNLALTKTGADSFTLSGDNSYTGATLVSAGTLTLSGTGDINSSSGITVNGSGAKLLQTSSVAVSPVVTLTQGTLTGSGTVNTVNVGAGTGGIISNNNGVAGAALTIGTLTFDGVATVNTFSNSTSAPIVTTSLVGNGTAGQVTINPSAAGWAAGTYDLISYSGGSITGMGGFGQFVLGTVTGVSPRQTKTFGNSGTAITLAIGADDKPVWTGVNGANWITDVTNSPTSGTPNWALQTGLTATDFWAADNVEFNDTYNIGGGPVAVTQNVVNISAANVSPTGTTFNNSAINYTLNGGFGIATGTLTKNGTGNVTISTVNTYTGATTINAGTITLSGSGTLGTGSALTLGGGKLDLGTLSRTVGAVSVTAPAVSGDTILNGSLTGTSYAASNTTGNAIISANLLVNGGAGFTKTGAGAVTLSGTNTYTGATAVNDGTLILSNANTISGATSVAGTGTLQLGNATSMGTSTTTLASGATLQLRNDVNTTFTAPIATPAAGVTYNFEVNQATGAGTGRTLTLGNITFATSTTNQINVTGGNGYTLALGTLTAGSGVALTPFTVNATTAPVTIVKFAGGGFGNALTLQGGNAITLGTFELNSNGANSLTVSGSGTVATLGTTTATNSRAGGSVSYTLNSGTLNLTTTTSLANRNVSGTAGAPTFTINGGTLNNTSGAALALAANSGLTAGSPNTTINGDFAFGTASSTNLNNLDLGLGTVSLGTTAGTSRTVTVNGGATLTLGGVISNGTTANSLAKDGTGILALSGTNGYTGGSSVTGGVLTFLNTNAKAVSGTHAFSANTTLGLGVAASGAFFTSTDVDNAFAGNMVGNLSNVTVDATTNVGIDTTSATFTYATSVAGSPTRALVKLGANTLNLTGTNTHTGGTNINAGTLSFANGALGTTGNITFTGSSTLQWNGTNTEDISGRLVMTNGVTSTFDTVANNVTLATGFGSSSTGALTKAGTGILTLSGANTYSGTTTISAGTLRLANTGALGTSALVSIGANTLQLGTDTAFSGPAISIAGGTIVSDRATAGAGLTHVLGNAAVSNATHNFTAGTNVTSGTAAIQLGNITNASGSGGNATLNPTTANLIITGGYEGVTNTGTNGLILSGSSSGNSVAGDIKNGTRTTQNLFKQGNSIWTLSGTNTYTGTTRVDAGALITTKAAALPGLNNLVTFNGGTLGARIGAGGWTTGEVDTLLLSTNAVKTSGALGIDTTTASLTQWTGFTTGVDSLGATLGLTKLGTNTLTLNSAGNNYAGTTTIDQGTLALSVDHTLAGALNFGFGGTNTNTGTLDLSAANASFGSLNVLTNSANNNTITIGSGKTLTISGNVTVGVNAANAVASLVTSGGGNLVVGTGGTNTFIVGGASGGTLAGSTAVDLSGLASLTVNYGSGGTFRLGDNNTGSNNPAPSTLKLATDNTITVGNFRIGDSSGGQSTHVLTLGNGVNTINATSVNIGSAGSGIRSGGSMIFDPADATGTLTLNGFGGTGTRTILNMVNTTGNTAASPTSIVNLAGHTANLNVSTLVMATRTVGGGATSTLTFDQGVLDVTTLNMANRSGTAGGVTATVNLGDSVAVGVPTVTIGGITMGVSASAGTATANLSITGGNVGIGTGSGTAINMANAGTGAASTSALSITGGTVTVTGNIIRTVGAGTETATLSVSGANAVLDMSGKNITSLTGITYTDGTIKNLGTVNTGMTLAGTGSRVFDQGTGVSGEIQGTITGTGIGLTKQGLGSLTLSSITNNYSGATTITGGTLSVSADTNLGTAPGSATPASLVINGGTLSASAGFTLDSNRGIALGTTGSTGGTIDVAAGTLGYGGIIANNGGTNTLTKTGVGILTLSGTTANTYTGVTTVALGTLELNKTAGVDAIAGDGANDKNVPDVAINGGTLRLMADNQLGNNVFITMTAGTFSLNGKNETIFHFSNSGGTFNSGRGGGLTVSDPVWAGGANHVFNTQNYGLTVAGPTVEVAHDISGGLNMVHGAEGFASAGSINVGSNFAILQFSGTTPNLTLNGDKTIPGLLSLTGNVNVIAGTQASITTGVALLPDADLTTIDITPDPDQTGVIPGKVELGSAARTFTLGTGASLAVSAVVQGSGGLTKAGDGVMTLSATNTYSGPTTISAGTLAITGLISSATHAITNGTLAGNGTISEVVTISAGGSIRPGTPGGSTTGTITVKSLSMANDATAVMGVDIVGITAGSGYDQVALPNAGTSTVSIAGASLSVKLGTLLSGDGSEKFYIIDNAALTAGTVSGQFANLIVEASPAYGVPTGTTLSSATPSTSMPGGFDFTDLTSGFVYTLVYNVDSTTNNFTPGSGNDVVLSVVPEPGSLALAAMGGLGLLSRRRRR
ncbi:autotransporter-associated beta strand repeat-containing protein [Humisphaera borealis]|uniref:Autotransporter-associated beta strand repeat-containing protein n=1 Tax=Humisphaera borealis TaxID=2807512 RepID=A0A7M2X0L7_9BACT|nr:autotransporter-associated beta strand repeat-containing protein [Humisphaera borealis]QOV90651.1 autotransporter-associated beta strand repeat-containing protein [Humisphaera borealis]